MTELPSLYGGSIDHFFLNSGLVVQFNCQKMMYYKRENYNDLLSKKD